MKSPVRDLRDTAERCSKLRRYYAGEFVQQIENEFHSDLFAR